MSKDLISRSGAIEQIQAWAVNLKNPKMLLREDAVYVLETLPSADRPKGKWILDPNGMDWNLPAWKCSECGCKNDNIGVVVKGNIGDNPFHWAGSRFCPHCGVKMVSAERSRR